MPSWSGSGSSAAGRRSKGSVSSSRIFPLCTLVVSLNSGHCSYECTVPGSSERRQREKRKKWLWLRAKSGPLWWLPRQRLNQTRPLRRSTILKSFKNSPKVLFRHVFLPPELFFTWLASEPVAFEFVWTRTSDLRGGQLSLTWEWSLMVTELGLNTASKTYGGLGDRGCSTEVIYSDSKKDFYSETTRHEGQEQERHADLEYFPILLSELKIYFDHTRGKKNQDWIYLEFTECKGVFFCLVRKIKVSLNHFCTLCELFLC